MTEAAQVQNIHETPTTTVKEFSNNSGLLLLGRAYDHKDPTAYIENLLDLFELMLDKNYGTRDAPFTDAAFAFLDALQQSELEKDGNALLSQKHRIQLSKLHAKYAPDQREESKEAARRFLANIGADKNSSNTDRLEAYIAYFDVNGSTGINYTPNWRIPSIMQQAKELANSIAGERELSHSDGEEKRVAQLREKTLAHMCLCKYKDIHQSPKDSIDFLNTVVSGQVVLDQDLRLRALASLPEVVFYRDSPIQLPFLKQLATEKDGPLNTRIKAYTAWKATTKSMPDSDEQGDVQKSIESFCKKALYPLLKDETKIVSARNALDSQDDFAKDVAHLRTLLTSSPSDVTFADLRDPDRAPYVKADEVLELSRANLAAVLANTKNQRAG